MKKIAFILSILFLLAASEKSFACSCMLNTKPLKTQVKEAFDSSSAIFSGEVIEITSKDEFAVNIKIKVEKSWKGNLSKEIIMTTAKDSAMCGYGFQVGQKYLVYAYGKMDALSTNICSRTTGAGNKSDIKYLDKLKKVKNKKS